MLSEYTGTDLEPILKSAFDKIVVQAPDKLRSAELSRCGSGKSRRTYCVAWCLLRNSERMFALHRVIDYKVLPDHFRERDIDIDAYLGQAFLLAVDDVGRRSRSNSERFATFATNSPPQS